jgi:CRP-like cAMP-binding protein
MRLKVSERQPLGNFILDSLPLDEYDRLTPNLQMVELFQSEVLYKTQQSIDEVYFPTTALLSWVHSTMEGETVEVGATGYEGLVGTTILLGRDEAPWEVDVLMTGNALKIDAQIFARILHESTILRQNVMAFTYLKMMQLTQSALCNRFHSVEQRLCRWLLAASDHVKRSELSLTRELLATMIGSTRPPVSIVTGTLQSAGLLQAARGKITILDRKAMEAATCECYHVVKQEFERYLNP